MRAYSVDLRERIVEAVKDKGLSKTATAELYGVSPSTVYRYLELSREGALQPKVRPGQARRLDEKACRKLLEQLERNNDLSLEEHAAKFAEEQGVELKKSSVANYFARLGVKRKKTSQAKERDDEARQVWLETVSKLDPDKFVFLDETGGWLGMTCLYARMLGGGRVYDPAPKRRKGKVSLIAAVTNTGMKADACLIHEASVDSTAFLSYIEHVLCSTLEPGQVVIMDNFTIHHNGRVKELIEAQGCELLYLPTYSPDFNPIEHLFAKLKAFIRKLRPDSLNDLIRAFQAAVLSISQDDARNAFRHCGYSSQ